MSADFDPIELLRTLEAHEVGYVVIGGFGAFIHGAPILTADIDIVYATDDANLERLCAALRSLGAVYRHQHGRRIEPSAGAFGSTMGAGHHLFETRSGDLDALRTVASRGYDDLVQTIVVFEVEELRIPVASLATIIELKQAANRPKDRAMLPTLRAVLDRMPDVGEQE